MQAFADVVRQGKALYIGVSEWTADQMREAHALATDLGVSLISNQPQYSMLWRVIESEVVPTSKELGIGQIVWSPIAQGVLTGKYAPGQPLPEGSRATDDKGGADMISRFMNDRVLGAVQELKPVASDLGLSMAQLAVAWVLQNDNVSAAIIGASRPEQVVDNAGASGVKLDADVLKRIDDVLGDLPSTDASQTRFPGGTSELGTRARPRSLSLSKGALRQAQGTAGGSGMINAWRTCPRPGPRRPGRRPPRRRPPRSRRSR